MNPSGELFTPGSAYANPPQGGIFFATILVLAFAIFRLQVTLARSPFRRDDQSLRFRHKDMFGIRGIAPASEACVQLMD